MGYMGNFTHIFVAIMSKSRQLTDLIKHTIQRPANIENNGEVYLYT
jgi:hypothetical protein